jgi:branched-chain amino acid transport system ATP-binding protein
LAEQRTPMAESREPSRLLEAENLDVAYGAIQVVWDVNLKLNRGEVASIIGANGAGKTTILRVLAGLTPVRRGRIIFNGCDVTSQPAHQRVLHHLCLVPEGRELWPRMTVEENLLMGAFSPPLRPKARQNLERIYQMFPRLAERRKQACGTLSGGEQQMCAIGRGLMAEPVLLLLDEPSLGLAPILVEQVFQTVRRIASEGVSILLATQTANDALQVSRSTYVMEAGRIVLEGLSEELRASDHVRRAYLGVAD